MDRCTRCQTEVNTDLDADCYNLGECIHWDCLTEAEQEKIEQEDTALMFKQLRSLEQELKEDIRYNQKRKDDRR